MQRAESATLAENKMIFSNLEKVETS